MAGIQYNIASHDCSIENVNDSDRFKYFDDLNILEFILLTDLLMSHDFHQHVASDICIDQTFLPSSSYEMQDKLNNISDWTEENLMLLNETKSNYIIYTRSK